MEIVNGILRALKSEDGFEVERRSTERCGGALKPLYILVHGTLETEPEHVVSTDPATKESTHLFIDAAGKVTQFASFLTKTWHAGASYWQGWHGLNNFAIGIHVYTGLDGYASENALATLHSVIPEIVAEYNIRDIMSHEQVTKRPGYQFRELNQFKPYVLYGNADSVGRFLAVADIVVRGGPDVAYEQMDKINAGEAVKILRYTDSGDWAFIIYERDDHNPRHGWAHESFLRRL